MPNDADLPPGDFVPALPSAGPGRLDAWCADEL